MTSLTASGSAKVPGCREGRHLCVGSQGSEFRVSPMEARPQKMCQMFLLCLPATSLCSWLDTSGQHQKMNTILPTKKKFLQVLPAQSTCPRIPRTGHVSLLENANSWNGCLRAASSAMPPLLPSAPPSPALSCTLPNSNPTRHFSKSDHIWWASRIELLRCFSRVLADQS